MVAMPPPPSTAQPSRRGHLLKIVIVGIVFVGVPALVLEYAGVTPLRRFAMGVVTFLWAVFFFGVALRRRRRDGKGSVPFNVGFLLLALTALEIYLGFTLRRPTRAIRQPAARTYVQKDTLLGYAPIPGSAARFTNAMGKEVVYDVTYTIDDHGYRVQPPVGDPPPSKSVLCFGCSFTYGTGLPNDETWPWHLQEDLGTTHRVYNLGYWGYGPHQMLAAVEGGRAAAHVEAEPTYALYLGIVDHARRITGKAGYSPNVPRYRMQPDGSVTRDGVFSDDASHRWGAGLRQLVGHSNLVRALTQGVRPEQHDVPLFVAIVAAARDRVADTWPACKFRVVLWDSSKPMAMEMEEGLTAEGIEVWRAEDLIPGLGEDPAAFTIHATDPHPNARATAALANALAERIQQDR